MDDLKHWFSWIRYYLLGVVVCAGIFILFDGWFAWLASLVFIACMFYLISLTKEYLEWWFIIRQARENVEKEKRERWDFVDKVRLRYAKQRKFNFKDE